LKKDKIAEYHRNYYEKIYEKCEQGIVRNTITHKIFDLLNVNPETEPKELFVEFYEFSSETIRKTYYIWVRKTYEKYIQVEKKG